MKLYPSKLFLGLFALVFAVSSIAHAAGKKKNPPPPMVPTTIASISADSITVTTGQNKSITYKITPQTKMFLNGQRVTANDLKSGSRVNVTPGFDGKTADEITASGPVTYKQPTPAPPKGGGSGGTSSGKKSGS